MVLSSCQKTDNSLETLIKKTIQTKDWLLLKDFISEEIKCEICIDKQTLIQSQNFPDRIDTIHKSLAIFNKEIILSKKLPYLFNRINEFDIKSIYNSGNIYNDKSEFEIHIPKKDGTQIDLHFEKINNKSKLVAIYKTP